MIALMIDKHLNETNTESRWSRTWPDINQPDHKCTACHTGCLSGFFFFFLSQQINHCDLFLRFTLISFKTIPIVLYLCPEARGADGYLQQQQRSRLRGQKQQRVVCKVADGGTMRGRIRDRNQGGETHPAWRLRSNTGQTVLL